MELNLKIFTWFKKPDETMFEGNSNGRFIIFQYVTESMRYRPEDVCKYDKVYFIDRYFYRVNNYKLVNFLGKFKFHINKIPVYFIHFQ